MLHRGNYQLPDDAQFDGADLIAPVIISNPRGEAIGYCAADGSITLNHPANGAPGWLDFPDSLAFATWLFAYDCDVARTPLPDSTFAVALPGDGSDFDVLRGA